MNYIMTISLRIIFWIPISIFFSLNMILKLLIFILQHIGNTIVSFNRATIKAGDWATDKAKNDDTMDNFLASIQNKKVTTKKMIDTKRGAK